MYHISHLSLQKISRFLLQGFIVIFALVMFQACDDDDDGPTNSNQPGNIAEVAQSNDDFSELVSALDEAGLVSTLEGDGPFTVFAPTNDAFANLPDGLLGSLSTEQLTEILSYHVISGSEIASGDLQAEQTVEAVAGGDLFVTVADGEVSVNDNATVTSADIEASNGVIHAIDQVLLPDSYQNIVQLVTKRYTLQSLEDAVVQAELVSTLEQDTQDGYTVFAPSNAAFEGVDLSGLSQSELQDILTYHVLPNTVLSGDLQASQVVETVNGQDLLIEAADGTVTLTDNSGQTYQVTQADIEGTNGVVHVIDGVLNPNPNIVDVASSAGNFSTLVSALQDADLVSTLESAGPFTVFAPNDDAFSGVDLSGFSNEQLTEILSYHVISGSEIASGDLEAQQAVDAVASGQLFVEADGDVIVNDNATVINADIGASNGVIHEIDNVLLPDAYQNVVGIVTKRYTLQTLQDAIEQAGLGGTLSDEQSSFTVFAPDNAAFEGIDVGSLSQQQLQDILTYHVLDTEVTSSEISSGTVTTVNGETLEIEVDSEGNVSLTDQAGNTYSVTTVDLQGTNGVVHIIDGVLMPS